MENMPQVEGEKGELVSGDLEIISGLEFRVTGIKEGNSITKLTEPKIKLSNEQTPGALDALHFDAISAFFKNADVLVTGNPSKTIERVELNGDISISIPAINHALEMKEIQLNYDDDDHYWTFEGLDEFVKSYVEDHWDDAEYSEK